MEYSVTRLIGLGVALALVAALSVVVWNIMSTRAPDTGATSADREMAQIATYELCKAAGGAKTVKGDRRTATPTTAGTTPTTSTSLLPTTKGAIPADEFCSR